MERRRIEGRASVRIGEAPEVERRPVARLPHVLDGVEMEERIPPLQDRVRSRHGMQDGTDRRGHGDEHERERHDTGDQAPGARRDRHGQHRTRHEPAQDRAACRGAEDQDERADEVPRDARCGEEDRGDAEPSRGEGWRDAERV